MFGLSALTAGVVLDWIFGDPSWLPHPVVLMGKLIKGAEEYLRRKLSGRELTAGILLVCAVVFVSTALPLAVLLAVFFLEKEPGPVMWCILAFWSFQLLAARGLCRESGKVRKALENRDLEEARKQVSMIVGRDTSVLDQAGIARAAVETVAENTSDGIVAPLMYMAVFGILGGFFYKAVNTMDSMVGYRNQRYLFFGRAAAKLDDFCNYLPARATGCLMVCAAWILGCFSPDYNGRRAWAVYRRDKRSHPSPNSAHGEAACAGALNIRLAGPAWYFGKLCQKPYIGQDGRPVQAEDIRRAGKLAVATEILALGCCWGAAWAWRGLNVLFP